MKSKLLLFLLSFIFITCEKYSQKEIEGIWCEDTRSTTYIISDDKFVVDGKEYLLKYLTDSSFVVFSDNICCDKDSVLAKYKIENGVLSYEIDTFLHFNIRLRSETYLLKNLCQKVVKNKFRNPVNVSALNGQWIDTSCQTYMSFDRINENIVYYGNMYDIEKYNCYQGDNCFYLYHKFRKTGKCFKSYKFEVLEIDKKVIRLKTFPEYIIQLKKSIDSVKIKYPVFIDEDTVWTVGETFTY